MTSIDPHVAADIDNKEKNVLHVENGQQSDDEKQSLEDDALNYFTPAEQKKIIHRLDRRLVTVVGVSCNKPLRIVHQSEEQEVANEI